MSIQAQNQSKTKAAINVVTLRLGGETMALPADCLREILEPVAVTRVPRAGAFVGGLINVRGAVVPLADLRVAFGMALTEATPDTRMLVLEVPVAGETVVVAILADKVHDVTAFDPATLEPIPAVGTRWPPEFVRGIGKWQDGFVILPDLERIFSQGAAQGAATGLVEEGI
ncbi:chemotaxis protein CheW [Rhodobacter ferrooxidans]|uniref:CheW protein n=1 Tax=Rhodobacter ferrooxidans TaxID=371731 RepID=C8S4H4_9RHOB|nr:chemotaxis protein CheW [Rhodobacter sp. SW2]EEW24141.1 CheW protein [Rhodobacter sp. SW2]